MTSVNTNAQPELPYQPPAYMDDLQKAPAEYQVKTGPGGTVVVGTPVQGQDGLAFVNKDSVTQSPRERHVTKTDPRFDQKVDTKTSQPWLEEPLTSDDAGEGPLLKTMENAPWLSSLSSYLVAAFELSPMTKTARMSSTMSGSLAEEMEFAKSGGAISDDTLLSDIETSSTEPRVPTSLMAGAGPDTTTLGATPQTTVTPEALAQKAISRQATISPESLAIIKSFSSSDPADVKKVLKALVKEHQFTPAEQKFISSMLDMLGEKIATNNMKAGTAGLAMGSQALILITLSTMLKEKLASVSSSSDKVALETALVDISAALSFANMDRLGNTTGASPEFTALNSKNAKQIQKALTTLLSAPTFGGSAFAGGALAGVVGVNEEIIVHLSKLLQERNIDGTLYALRSDDPAILCALFSTLLQQIPGIPPDTVKKIADGIASRLAPVNAKELDAQLRSTDPDLTLDAMMHKSGLHYDTSIPHEQKKIIVDYLKVLSNALAFLAQIRASIVQLEGRVTQDTAALRLGAVNEQLQIANKRYDLAIKKASTELASLAAKIKEAEVLKILMPIIGVVIALVILVVAIITLITAIPTGGVAAVVGAKVICGLVAAMIGVISAAAAVAVAVTNMILQFTVGKTMYDAFFDAVAPHLSPLARSGIIMGIELGVAILITIITLGAGAAILIGGAIRIASQGAKMGAEVASRAAEATVKFIMQATIRETMMKAQKELVKELLKAFAPLVLIGVVQGVQGILTSNFIFEAVQAIAKKNGATDEEAAKTAMIVQMILTAIVLLVGLLAGGASIGKTAIGAVKTGAKAAGSGLTKLAESLSRVTKEAIAQFFQTLIPRIKNAVKDFFAVTIPTMLTNALETGASFLAGVKGRIVEGTKYEARDSIAARMMATGATADSVQQAVDAAVRAIQNESISKTLFKLLKNLAKESPDVVVDLLRVGAKGLQIGATAIEIETAVIQMNLSKAMAEIEKEVAEMDSLLNFLTATSKGAASATMQAINESASQNYETFKNLVRMVADFIESARAAMRVHDVSR